MSGRGKPPSAVRLGMKADEVLKLRGRSKEHAVGPARWLEPGVAATWHYDDCVVVLRRREPGGPYRVEAVLPMAEAG